MADLKKVCQPKVAVPLIGIIVLIVVGALVAVFYLRNPTITDDLFVSMSSTPSSEATGEERSFEGVEAVTSANGVGSSTHEGVGGAAATHGPGTAGGLMAGSGNGVSSAPQSTEATTATTTKATVAAEATTAAASSSAVTEAKGTAHNESGSS